ncbi:hypothetical protein [uncultured Campylobacter sp.]|uniref:hypothetical protein n=1 Tax=uncultured Campylobacter sp. TaxID=218934 RepID=UPI0026338106|nr:hypothetical protein [uncultured Campylobacter sp.]
MADALSIDGMKVCLSDGGAMDRQTARHQRRTMTANFKHNLQAENPPSIKCEFLKFYH